MATAALGGTFDIIHRGHMALLGRAFKEYDHVIIGLAGDGLARRRGKRPVHGYAERLANLHAALGGRFSGRYEIVELDDDFGPAVLGDGVAALIVSEETAKRGDDLNRLRIARGARPARIIIVDLVNAEDGSRLSSSRIRAREVDTEGRLTR